MRRCYQWWVGYGRGLKFGHIKTSLQPFTHIWSINNSSLLTHSWETSNNSILIPNVSGIIFRKQISTNNGSALNYVAAYLNFILLPQNLLLYFSGESSVCSSGVFICFIQLGFIHIGLNLCSIGCVGDTQNFLSVEKTLKLNSIRALIFLFISQYRKR